MKYTVPHYYKKFNCLAGECPATCCAGWQIVIDERSLRKYAGAKGPVGNFLRNGVNFQDQVFHQYDKRCAFLNEDNLCDMHIEAGTDMMCSTCRKYPRHIEVFQNEREISLSISCPAVAKLILEEKKIAIWMVAEDDREDKYDDSFDDFLYSALQDTRDLMIRMLQDRSIPVHLRMAEVLCLAHDVQNRVNSRQMFDIRNVCERYERSGAQKRLQEKISGEHRAENRDMLSLLTELETLDPGWKECVEVWKVTAEYKMKLPETELEQMAVYYLFTYFCGAVYDGDLLAKAKMSIVSTLLWETICKREMTKLGRDITFAERCKLAWSYSRELEHSDLNLNKMEEMMNERKEADFADLLGYLAENV